MESAQNIRTQETKCPEVTLSTRDQMDEIHRKCNEVRVPVENTDTFQSEVLENHGEERDPKFKEVQKGDRWENFETELEQYKDTKGRDGTEWDGTEWDRTGPRDLD